METLDVGAIKAFVLAAELRSFTRAAELMGTTQSAVSLRLRRLEEQLGRRLLERTPRQVCLSADGLAFIAVARELLSIHDRAATVFRAERRRMVIGISHQLIGGELPSLLRRMKELDPNLLIEIRVAGTRQLMLDYERGELDAALVLRADERRKQGRVAFSETFSWFAAPDWIAFGNHPLPLATQGESCRIRNAAVRALDKAGIAWREVFVGQGAATVGAAATAGLAVAVLARRTAPTATIDVSTALSLPPIPAQDVMLYSGLRDGRSREVLRMLTLAFS